MRKFLELIKGSGSLVWFSWILLVFSVYGFVLALIFTYHEGGLSQGIGFVAGFAYLIGFVHRNLWARMEEKKMSH